MRPARRSRPAVASRLLAALGDQLLGETAISGLAESRTYPTLHGLRFLDDETVVLDPSHERVTGLESDRLANRSGNYHSPLGSELDFGVQLRECHYSCARVISRINVPYIPATGHAWQVSARNHVCPEPTRSALGHGATEFVAITKQRGEKLQVPFGTLASTRAENRGLRMDPTRSTTARSAHGSSLCSARLNSGSSHRGPASPRRRSPRSRYP